MVAETKLYDALSIQPSANEAEIKKAYKKAALKHHPDKNKDDPKSAEKFKDVSQAYEILSDPDKRKVYDQYGLDFLLKGGQSMPESASPGGAGFGGMPGGMPSGFGGMPGGFGGMPGGATFSFSSNGGFGGGGRGGHAPSDPFKIFEQFAAGGMQGGGEDDDDIFSSFGRMGGGMPGGFGGRPSAARNFSNMNGTPKRQHTPEVTVVEKPLKVSLEDLFKGTNKRLQITRKTFDDRTNKQSSEKKVLDVPIKAGLKPGSKIKFSGVGDQIEGGTQDLHFIVEELPHDRFKREGDDLKQVLDIDLKESLCGWSRTVKTIDGRQLPISAGGPTGPAYIQRYPGQGMPKSKSPGERGDLVVTVNIKYPQSLTVDQKAKLREIL